MTMHPGGSRSGDWIRVERLEPARSREAGGVLAASHADYPAFRHLFARRTVRQRVLRPFMAATARDAALHGHALVARDDLGVLGVALWMPPGASRLSARRKAAMTPALVRAAVRAPRWFPAFMRVGAALENAHPAEAAWYLEAMGVHPRAQRRGVGSRLITPVLTLADESGLPCYLQTSDPANIEYYRRYGFEVSQPSIETIPDGPRYIGMTRPASARHPGTGKPA